LHIEEPENPVLKYYKLFDCRITFDPEVKDETMFEKLLESDVSIQEELIGLLPKSVFALQRASCNHGELLPDGTIAIDIAITEGERNQYVAKAVITLLHELAHKKSFTYGKGKCFYLRSPQKHNGDHWEGHEGEKEKWDGDAGNYLMMKLGFGCFESRIIQNMSLEGSTVITDIKCWENDGRAVRMYFNNYCNKIMQNLVIPRAKESSCKCGLEREEQTRQMCGIERVSESQARDQRERLELLLRDVKKRLVFK